jgi:midasin (ATPase involved in ribosome maturation)
MKAQNMRSDLHSVFFTGTSGFEKSESLPQPEKLIEELNSIDSEYETEKKLSLVMEQKRDIIRARLFIQLGLITMGKYLNSSKQKPRNTNTKTFENSSIPIFMIFKPGIVFNSVIFGRPLLFRSIHLPPASVLERLNSLLEEPRSLILAEDTQQHFSLSENLRKVNNNKSHSIPIHGRFSIGATTSESGFLSLSRPLQSRFTCIYCPPYSMTFKEIEMKELSPDLEHLTANITHSLTRDKEATISTIRSIYR